MTLPANVSHNVASETYEYDRAFDANGVTNLNGATVAGRGLVTKITHGDSKYQTIQIRSFTETNVGKITSCARLPVHL